MALHHASIPVPEREEFGGYVNEGIRVSRLIKFIQGQEYSADQQGLVDQLFAEHSASARGSTTTLPTPVARSKGTAERGSLWETVPLEIQLRLAPSRGNAPSAPETEAIIVDPDYASREGYDPDFLGTGDRRVPLPELSERLIPLAAISRIATTDPSYLLPYHHFSVVMNSERRLAFFTAGNIDGNTSFRLKRESDRWFQDPRIGPEEQTDEEVYRNNPLDRGHLVRRLDPAWGESAVFAKACNDDTFHFTNCTPQHEDFNQDQTAWAGLEDYILENADNLNFKVSVFTGPVLAEDDQVFKDVRLPRQFWKVVAMVKDSGELSATAYLLSQEELIRGLELVPEEFSYGAYRTYQVPVRRIEELTGLSLGSLANADPLARQETAVTVKEITRHDQLVL